MARTEQKQFLESIFPLKVIFGKRWLAFALGCYSSHKRYLNVIFRIRNVMAHR
jgi:hypothetical protein